MDLVDFQKKMFSRGIFKSESKSGVGCNVSVYPFVMTNDQQIYIRDAWEGMNGNYWDYADKGVNCCKLSS